MISFSSKALLLVLGFWLITLCAVAQAPSLGAFFEYNVAGKQGVTNTLETTIPGKLASVDAPAMGFPPGVVLRGISDQGTSAQVIAAAQSAYTTSIGLPGKMPITAAHLVTGSFTPGVYEYTGNATINNPINLNSQGNTNAVFIFIIRGSLTVGSGAFFNADADTKVANVHWIVQDGLDVGSSAVLRGNFIAQGNIYLAENASANGRVASLGGTVALNKNTFTIPNDLGVTVSNTPGSMGEKYYQVGETIVYTITAQNNGPIDDNNVTVTFRFTGVEQVFSPSAGTVSPGQDGNWIWTIGRLEVGESKALTITAKMPATSAGEIIVSNITGNHVDENRTNNAGSIQNLCTVLPKPGDIEGPTQICVGEIGVFKVPAVSGITRYHWELPSFLEIVSGHSTNEITVMARNENTNINATIQVYVKNDCFDSPRSSLRVTNAPPKPDQPGPIEAQEGICTGTVAYYSIAAVDRATNYIWKVPEGWEIQSGQGSTRIAVMPGESEGQVSVIAENSCGESAERTLEVKPFLDKPQQPTPITGNSQMTVCFNADRVTFGVQASADVKDYVWKDWPTAWTLIEGQGTNNITFNPNGVAGEVTINGSNPCGNSEIKFTLQIIPDQPIAIGEISGAFPICKGSNGTKYSIPEVPFATEYYWALPKGWRIVSGHGTREITVDLDIDAEGGEVSVLVINQCGLEGRTKKNVEATTAMPIAPASITGDTFTCTTKDTYYSTNTVAGAQEYIWEVPTGWEILEGQGTVRIKVKFGITEGEVKVRARNSCGTSDPAVLRVKPFSPIPDIPFVILGPSNPICENQENVVFQLAPVDQAQKYTWFLPAGWEIVEGHGTNRVVVNVSKTAGTLRVTAENPCGESQAASLPVTLQPNVPAPKPGPITGETQYCAGKNQTYSISPVNGAVSYQWIFPGSDWEVIGPSNGTSVTVRAGTSQGEVKVRALNNCGTPGEIATLALQFVGQVPPAPTAIASDTETYCGNQANLGYRVNPVPTATSYEWTVPAGWIITSGLNTNEIKVTAGVNGGEITVKAINSCGESQSVKIMTAPQRALMNPETIQGPDVPCFGRTDAVYSIPAIDGAETYLWELPDGWKIMEGEGTNRITVEVAGRGKLKVRARNACGITGAAEKTVEVVTTAPLAPLAITGNTLACATRTATYSTAAVANASFYTWTVPTGWTIVSGQGTTEVTVLVGANAGEVKVAAENDCSSSDATVLAIAPTLLPTVSRIIDKTVSCSDVATFELESNSAGASAYTWTVPNGWEILSGQGTPTISVRQGNAKGEVSVVADNGLCQSDAVKLFSDPSLRDADLVIPNVFSPNNDGNNDTWVISNLANFPDNDLVVVNRWGNEVYKSRAYQNNWNGDKLAEGTYYYVLRLTQCDGSEKVYKGYVMIVR